MQVGDYIIQQPYKSDTNYFRIFKVLRICIDGCIEVEPQAMYDAIAKKKNISLLQDITSLNISLKPESSCITQL